MFEPFGTKRATTTKKQLLLLPLLLESDQAFGPRASWSSFLRIQKLGFKVSKSSAK
jgi:hypothetical protein